MQNKSTIVIGSVNNGKSAFINDYIKENINENNVVKIDGRFNPKNISKFFFKNCDCNTQYIVVNDIINTDVLYFFASRLMTGINVNKPAYFPFRIYPKFILECSKNQFPENYFKDQLSIFMRCKFEVIDIDVLTEINKTV